jgi:hypothetical protein
MTGDIENHAGTSAAFLRLHISYGRGRASGLEPEVRVVNYPAIPFSRIDATDGGLMRRDIARAERSDPREATRPR